MKVSYFPGCTLRNKARDLDRYARASAEALGIELCELPEWQCCGGVFVSARDEIASKLPSVRALIAARDEGRWSRSAPRATTSSSRPTTPCSTTRPLLLP